MKTCHRCKVEKESTEFYSRGGKQKHLLDSWCMDCRKSPEVRAKANLRNQKYEKGTRARLYEKNPLFYLWYIAKKRAQKQGYDFSITPEDIIFTGFCPVTKRELNIGTNKLHDSVSLDRVDNTKGYVPGNVVAISRWANLKKSNMTIGDLEAIISYIKEYTK